MRTGPSQLLERVEIRASPIHGKGVFAKQRIRKDARIGVYEGPRTVRNGIYVLWFEDSTGALVGINGRNTLRYLNHSRTPNAVFWGDELFSLQEISIGTEITFDYGEDWAHVD